MKSVVVCCVIFVILSNIAFVFGEERPIIKDQLTRTTREANKEATIDCKMGPWSKWGTCDPCSKMQFRSRTVEAFGQFGGQACNQPLGDRKACKTELPCIIEEPAPCTDTEFQCESGVCIKKRLECNGDNDCGDFSDEDICDSTRSPCGPKYLELSEMGRTAGHGVNILGSEPRGNAFNNELFNGICSQVRDPNTLEKHRIPWNVAVLTYQTRVDETHSKEVFESSSTLLKEIMEENKFSISGGLSFKFEPTEPRLSPLNVTNVKADLKLTYDRTEVIKTMTEYRATKDKSFIRIKGKLQMGTFRMRSRQLMVTETFLSDVSYLPLNYEKGEYFRFLEDYGTHYAASGKEGGEYEFVYVLNNENMKNRKVTSRDVNNCFSLDASLNFQGGSGIGGEAGIKPSYCSDLKKSEDGATNQTALIDKVMPFVSGGTLEASAALKTKLSKTGVLDLDTYVAWAKTLTAAPVVIENQLEAIHSLIPVNMQHAETKKDNLRRAFEDYIAEYNVCKCQPCKNGGTVSLVNGECICLCLPQFMGQACQNIKAEELKHYEKTAVQEGNWGCWSSWSNCSEGQRSRSRVCNTKGLTGGTCKGETLNTDYC